MAIDKKRLQGTPSVKAPVAFEVLRRRPAVGQALCVVSWIQELLGERVKSEGPISPQDGGPSSSTLGARQIRKFSSLSLSLFFAH
ncbi:hypothetical protein GOP47_0004086 [Adiantum capillus-veneris]|uniref:Uncharacterized protein n=1 Tax=Adiantum capillus-veneris TaxID=13818 RepID=A0A9D4ZM95_ADICA|nr:hypothetical protein GOP47_0004086 [Adiantum capillus-veneris]